MSAYKNIDDLDLLEVHKKNLARLNLQKAKYGTIAVPLHILNQIDDEEKAIKEIERKIDGKPPIEKFAEFPLPPNLHNQTPPEENFVGRIEMRENITGWYKDSEVRIGVLIGWGGVGKSALARKWYDSLNENNIQPDGIFWWGFYRNPYLDVFLNELLRYVSQGELDPETIKNTWDKVERIKGYLHKGVKGDDEAIKEVIEKYKGHALSLTLLAGFLNRYHQGDINYAPDIRFVLSDEKRFADVNKLLKRYSEKMSEAELSFLKLFSLFRKEITERDFSGVFRHKIGFNDVLVNMSELDFKDLVNGLVEWRLISEGEREKERRKGEGKVYTTHPLIKGFFESVFDEEDNRLCHKRLYHYFGEIAPPEPENLEEMQPLFEQVYHGCKAGMYQEADDVYWQKVQRRDERFLIHKLGAWETNLALVQNFFPDGDLQKEPLVPKIEAKSYFINEAGLSMMMIGRLKEAEELYKKAIELYISQKNWGDASVGYQNLVDLQIRTGNLQQAKKNIEEAIRLSREARNVIYEYNSTAYLAYALFLLGETDKAGIEFERANEFQRKDDTSIKYLYSLKGIWYANFLLARGKIQEALDVTNENLRRCERNNWIDAINLCHRSLASIYRHLKDFQEAEKNTALAIEDARKTGRQDIEAQTKARFIARETGYKENS